VSTTDTAAICAAAFTPQSDFHCKAKNIYCNLLGVESPRNDVQSIFFLGYSMSGESYIFEGEKFSAQPQDLEFAQKWLPLAEKLWAEGKLKTHPECVGANGLLGCVGGMEEMRRGRVSGIKLVYRVDDTVWPS
jgi:hypothetical protein